MTLTAKEGTGGEVKTEPEDFIVKEITKSGAVLQPGVRYKPDEIGEEEAAEGEFTTFVLEKRNWETIRAILMIAKRLGRGRKSISYAGTKDKQAVTVQLACIYGVEPKSMEGISIRDIKINGAWGSNGLELGENLGNAFSVKLKNIKNGGNLAPILNELNGVFPNYFDRQRFGYRLNNPRIGLSIIKGEAREAAMAFLTDITNEVDEESREARQRLAEETDFRKALAYFPKRLKYERTMIDYLSRYDNFANAIRKLPRGIVLMFVHSVEDLIFNAALEERIRAKDFETGMYCKGNFYGFPDLSNMTQKTEGMFAISPLVGYETKEDEISEYEKRMMEKMGIERSEFHIKSFPELSMRGTHRVLLSPVRNFSYTKYESNIQLNFSIPTGSYATIFLNEITKSKSMGLESILWKVSS